MPNSSLNNLSRTEFFFMYRDIYEFYVIYFVYCNTTNLFDEDIEAIDKTITIDKPSKYKRCVLLGLSSYTR